VRKSKACVVNIPTVDLAPKVVGIGNTSGRDIDKFATFKLTAVTGRKVKAPLIEECHANFECRLLDSTLINRYSLFVFEVVKGHARVKPRFPKTLHYRGDGLFMIAGPTVSRYRKGFTPEMLRA
jgi:flavin reductase (DIM6/NTAB) family NADH-FMN oxidoreductase RutF